MPGASGAPCGGAGPGAPGGASGRSQAKPAPHWRRLSRRQGGALGGHTRRRSVLAWCRLGQVCVWDARRVASGAVFWRFRGVVGPNLDPSAPLGSTHSVGVRSLPSTATFGPSTSPPLDTLAIATKNCLGQLIWKKCGFWNPQIALVQKPTFFRMS